MRPGNIIATPIDALPENAIAVVEFKSLESFSAENFSTPQWQDLNKLQLFRRLEESVVLLSELASGNPEIYAAVQGGKIAAAAIGVKSGEVEYIFAMQAKGLRLNKLELLLNSEKAQVSKYSSSKTDIYEFAFAGSTVICTKVGNLFLCSKSKILIEASVAQLKNADGLGNNEAFRNVYTLNTKNDVPDFYLNLDQFALYAGYFLQTSFSNKIDVLRRFTAWIGFEWKITENAILMNGYASGNRPSQPGSLSEYTGNEVAFDLASNFLLRNTAYYIQSA
ncbi:MAG: hypothetical protein ACK4IY_05435, partial [Chitinophagales bacterium]